MKDSHNFKKILVKDLNVPWSISVMKSAYRSVMFYIGQKELEMQYKMNRIVSQCRQKCETMQQKFTEKLEQVHTAYQKMAKRCQMMEQEMESVSKDKQELQEKFSEKSRLVYICSLKRFVFFWYSFLDL